MQERLVKMLAPSDQRGLSRECQEGGQEYREDDAKTRGCASIAAQSLPGVSVFGGHASQELLGKGVARALTLRARTHTHIRARFMTHAYTLITCIHTCIHWTQFKRRCRTRSRWASCSTATPRNRRKPRQRRWNQATPRKRGKPRQRRQGRRGNNLSRGRRHCRTGVEIF